MLAEIKITNATGGVTVIDIEGVIGVPEEWQFEEPAGRVATYRTFRDSLAAISKIRSSEVIVNIRSTGGDVGDALLIYDALTALDARITTRCYGYVASAATIIAQAAGPGCREISANSLYLVHNAVSACEGNVGDFRQRQELLAKTDERIASIYAARSGRDVGEFTTLMAENNGNGRWMSPAETLEMGLVDRITDPAPISNEAEELIAENPTAESLKRRGLAGRIAALVDFISGGKAIPPPADTTDADALHWQQDAELASLRNKISTLEAQNAQLRAKPTETRPKEDPTPAESRPSANHNAYQRDAESLFK
jgi:ATP-dependent protease ClpP protease subunit